MGTGELLGQPGKMLVVTYDELASHPGGVVMLLITSCYRDRSTHEPYVSFDPTIGTYITLFHPSFLVL